MSGPSAEGPPPRLGTAAGDGERLVDDEMVVRAQTAYEDAAQFRDGYPHKLRAALAAVAADLDRGGYDRARRDCADELREFARKPSPTNRTTLFPSWLRAEMREVADRWSAGRAPAGEEEQR